ncbi:Aste57867_15507 [Aphanomyces stellatus]|uniref:Aste57867_15507 protein n=1 Tax=Aphanomyces stellatus TaxID=120398 RepID=A0A485L3A4_9STRA|nr:hypothetical protein As57867_015451 [Aphanomyces stellatus]VFT92309.1 Aste57867_15507 [Aphanomyces stellatus]
MVRMPSEPELFIKLGQPSQHASIGITWANTRPHTMIVGVKERSIAWVAGLVPGMLLCGAKMHGERCFEVLDGSETPELDVPGTFPRILVLECTYKECKREMLELSSKIRQRSQSYKSEVKTRLGGATEAAVLVETQRKVAEEWQMQI